MDSLSIIDALENGKKHSFSHVQQQITKVLENGDIKTSDPMHHRFFYEIRPIGSLAKYISASEIILPDRSASHDGEITVSSDTYKVECTRAVDGHQESLRMEHLHLYKRAPAFQEIKASGTKNKRILEEQEVVAREIKCPIWNQEITSKLCEAFDRKNCEPQYQNYLLIITFDDWELPSSEDKKYFLAPISDFWRIKEANSIFNRVLVIGDSQKFIWDSGCCQIILCQTPQ